MVLLLGVDWFFVSSLGVVSDSVTSFDSNSPGKVTTLLLFLGQESLDPECLVRRHGEEQIQPHIGWQGREEEAGRRTCIEPVFFFSADCISN